jgi:hypothetical protein
MRLDRETSPLTGHSFHAGFSNAETLCMDYLTRVKLQSQTQVASISISTQESNISQDGQYELCSIELKSRTWELNRRAWILALLFVRYRTKSFPFSSVKN